MVFDRNPYGRAAVLVVCYARLVHAAVLQLAPVLAAAKSKVPYYIAGGLLVSWALLVSLGLGLRKPEFPGSASGQRAVVAITAVLVVATVSMAVATSSGPG
jgi:hypothetical protein